MGRSECRNYPLIKKNQRIVRAGVGRPMSELVVRFELIDEALVKSQQTLGFLAEAIGLSLIHI